MVIPDDRRIKLAYIFRDQENVWLSCHGELLQVRKLISLSPPPRLSLHSTIIEKHNKRLACSAWRQLMAADVVLALRGEERLQRSVYSVWFCSSSGSWETDTDDVWVLRRVFKYFLSGDTEWTWSYVWSLHLNDVDTSVQAHDRLEVQKSNQLLLLQKKKPRKKKSPNLPKVW